MSSKIFPNPADPPDPPPAGARPNYGAPFWPLQHRRCSLTEGQGEPEADREEIVKKQQADVSREFLLLPTSAD
jgi:hypothetical protein